MTVALMIGILGLILGTIGASGVILSWIRKPDIKVSDISASFSDPPVKGGTVLLQRNTRNIIPAIYGSVVVENRDSVLSEPLRTCDCEIRIIKDGDMVLEAIGAWDEQGKGSLEKEVDIRKGGRKQLHIFRAILEPSQKSSYANFQEKEATSFPILRIGKGETPTYQSNAGKVWIEMPEMVEATFGGWRAKKKKPVKTGNYEIVLKFKAENLDLAKRKKIDFKQWLKENRDYWQQNWQKHCRHTINKAKAVIDAI